MLLRGFITRPGARQAGHLRDAGLVGVGLFTSDQRVNCSAAGSGHRGQMLTMCSVLVAAVQASSPRRPCSSTRANADARPCVDALGLQSPIAQKAVSTKLLHYTYKTTTLNLHRNDCDAGHPPSGSRKATMLKKLAEHWKFGGVLLMTLSMTSCVTVCV